MEKSNKLKTGIFIVITALILGGFIAGIVNKKAISTKQQYNGISGDRGVFGESIAVHDAADGEVVILNKLSSDTKKPELTNNPIGVKTTSNPDSIWNSGQQAGTFTPAEKAKLKDGNLGLLTISKIGLSVNVFESTTTDTVDAMKNGVAHFPNTSAWDGAVGLSSHNVNYDGSAGYFYNLHKLKEGDYISYMTAFGERIYQATSVTTIADSDWSPLSYSEENKIVLITCITGQPQNRLCVQAIEVKSK